MAAGKRLLASGHGGVLAYALLGGVAVQIALALLYKAAMWYLYIGEFNPKTKASALYKASDWLSESYRVELTIRRSCFTRGTPSAEHIPLVGVVADRS